MFTITNTLIDRLSTIWETSDSIDDYIMYASAAFCVVSVFPLTVSYDIGYMIGSQCPCAVPVLPPVESATEKPMLLRRSARLAEKRLRDRFHGASLN